MPKYPKSPGLSGSNSNLSQVQDSNFFLFSLSVQTDIDSIAIRISELIEENEQILTPARNISPYPASPRIKKIIKYRLIQT